MRQMRPHLRLSNRRLFVPLHLNQWKAFAAKRAFLPAEAARPDGKAHNWLYWSVVHYHQSGFGAGYFTRLENP